MGFKMAQEVQKKPILPEESGCIRVVWASFVICISLQGHYIMSSLLDKHPNYTLYSIANKISPHFSGFFLHPDQFGSTEIPQMT